MATLFWKQKGDKTLNLLILILCCILDFYKIEIGEENYFLDRANLIA